MNYLMNWFREIVKKEIFSSSSIILRSSYQQQFIQSKSVISKNKTF